MATLFDWADKITPKTKTIVIGLVLFGVFLALQPDQKSTAKTAYTPPAAPVTTLTVLPTANTTITQPNNSANENPQDLLNQSISAATGLKITRIDRQGNPLPITGGYALSRVFHFNVTGKQMMMRCGTLWIGLIVMAIMKRAISS